MAEISSESVPSSKLWDIIRFVVVVIVAIPLGWYYCFYTPVSYVSKEHTGKTMGTDYIVKVPLFPETADWQKTATDIQNRLDTIDKMMSTYQPDSEVCRFNAFSSTEEWFPVSPETANVVQTALEISQLTEGAFDITAAPLVQHWGFGAGGDPKKNRTFEDLSAAAVVIQKQIGYEKLAVRLDSPALKKTDPALTIDLSGIAKGYAADCIAKLLDEQKITDYLIEVGGEVRCKGKKSKDKDWIVGIEKPTAAFSELHQPLPLKDQSLATSGSYMQRLEIEGQGFSHIVDPRTGLPMAAGNGVNELVSVSVLAADCASADAWATALFVLGEKKGCELADQQGLPVLFLMQNGKEITESASKNWGK